MTNDFWDWLQKAYRGGDVGNEPKFTKYNMEVAFAAGAAAEREACARVCEEIDKGILDHEDVATCATAIRARGQDPMPLFDDWGKDWK